MQATELNFTQRPRRQLTRTAKIALIPFEFVGQQGLKRVLDRRHIVKPLPVYRNLCSLQEEAAGQEEERGGRDHNGVACDVAWHERADQHHVGVGGDQRREEDDPEVEQATVEPEHEFGDGREGEALDGEEGDVDDEGGDDVRMLGMRCERSHR